MGVIRRLFEVIIDITKRLDEEVERGYNLNEWGDQMKFLHALQIQAQALIDLVLRACGLLGHAPTTPLDAAKRLRERGLLDDGELDFFRKVLGFRNIVVHGYSAINLEIVDDILRNRKYRRVLELAKAIVKRLPGNLDP